MVFINEKAKKWIILKKSLKSKKSFIREFEIYFV
tara:strand:- start:574 stop:675 length:102 start_codon:yes stop_codon:yes gene_type:complete